MNLKLRKVNSDKVIWLVVFLLSILSLMEVYSTIGRTAYNDFGGNTTKMLFKQIAIIITGFTVIWITQQFPYKRLAGLSKLGFLASIPLLLLTLIVGLSSGKDAGRWLSLPVVGQFQTSEIAKIILIVYIARLLTLKKSRIKEKQTFWEILIPVGIICGLIFRENFSTSAILFLACFVMMFIAGVNKQYMLRLVIIGIAGLLGMFLVITKAPQILPRGGTWVRRIEDFRAADREEVSQVNWAKMAIATGGPVGKRIGNTEFARFFDASHNDFIFAIIIEEGGLMLGLVVIVLYSIFFFRCRRIALQKLSPEGYTFGSLSAIGLGTLLIIQAVVNMAVAVNLAPVTGQTLPFVSYGGTSFLSCSLAVGIILSISADANSNTELSHQDALFYDNKNPKQNESNN